MINSESMKIEDLKTKIADAINSSDLSPSVIKLVIDGIAKEVTTLASQELVADIKKWKAEQEEEDRKMAENIQQQARSTTVPVYDEMDLVENPQPKAKPVPVDNKIDLQDK